MVEVTLAPGLRIDGDEISAPKLPICQFTKWLDDGRLITYSRWGDGEWNALLGRKAAAAVNCDGHKFFPAMGRQLAAVLKSLPKYMLGFQPMAARLYGKPIIKFVEATSGLAELAWYSSETFHRAMGATQAPDGMSAFLAAMRRYTVVIVGAAHLRKLTVLPTDRFVEVPARDAYLALDQTWRRTSRALAKLTAPAVVSVSTGMSSGLLIDRLYQTYGDQHTILDLGSVWDPFADVRSRTYMGQARTHPMPA